MGNEDNDVVQGGYERHDCYRGCDESFRFKSVLLRSILVIFQKFVEEGSNEEF